MSLTYHPIMDNARLVRAYAMAKRIRNPIGPANSPETGKHRNAPVPGGRSHHKHQASLPSDSPCIDTASEAGILSHFMENIKLILARAVVKILNPLVRLLLRHEISHSEFSELAKRSYVDVAYKYFSIPKRKQTYSRVSVITGLSRKEVVRLANLDEDQPPVTKGPLNRAARVISGWLRDPDFLDDNNEPKQLPLRGETISFDELVARYSGDITARAILDELMRVGAVVKGDNQTVKLSHHGYVPEGSQLDKIDLLSICASDLLNTVVHNLNCDKQDARFQRQVAYVDIPEHVIEEFKQYSHDKNLALLLDYNKWLAEKKKKIKPKPGEATRRVGVGVYFFESDETNKKG